MDYWATEVALSGWMAVLGGMALGAFLYACGFVEGRREAGHKPAALPSGEGWPGD